MKVITTISNDQEAFLLRDALAEEGIEAFIQNEGTADIFSGLAFADVPIAVRDEDYDRAMEFLIKYNKNLED